MLHLQNQNSPIKLLNFQNSNHRSLKLQAGSLWCSPRPQAWTPCAGVDPPKETCTKCYFITLELGNVHGPVSGFLFHSGSVCLFRYLSRILCQAEAWSHPELFLQGMTAVFEGLFLCPVRGRSLLPRPPPSTSLRKWALGVVCPGLPH